MILAIWILQGLLHMPSDSIAASAATQAATVASAASQATSAASDTIRFIAPASVVITATRTEKAIEDVAVPTTLVGSETLRRQGNLRLSDVLAGLPGVMLTDDHGTGVQLQGLSPDYTLILLNGEPVIGRNAGTLDLNRLSIRGLDRVEIVKGPSSSLYGSEALAGVVNLITRRPDESTEGGVQFRHGTHGTTDATLELGLGNSRHGVRLMVNRFGSNGYDLQPEQTGWTAPSFTDHTVDLRGVLWKGAAAEARIGARAALQEQQGLFAVRSWDGAGTIRETRYDDLGSRREWSLHPELEIRWADGLRSVSSAYLAGYDADVDHLSQEDGSALYRDRFSQTLVKAEQRVIRLWTMRHLTIGGGGLIREGLDGNRYGDGTGREESPRSEQWFAYLQHEWMPTTRLDLNASMRFDSHSDYAPRLSPKLSMLYELSETVRLRASAGSGFKAPAFRQLYLAFSNSNAGYSVFGSDRIQQGIRQLQEQGQIESLLIDVDRLQGIGAEHSIAFNAGMTVTPSDRLRVDLNAFHNDVSDMIETQPVAVKTNGQYVFGYFNLEEIYTRGLQLDLSWTSGRAADGEIPGSGSRRPAGRILARIDAGYQLLQAHDRAIVRSIRDGSVYGRDANGRDTRIAMGDYSGLLGRSAHSASMRLTLSGTPGGGALSTRVRWRSRFGYRDLDGNQFANRADEFIPGHAVMDVTWTRDITLRKSDRRDTPSLGRRGSSGRDPSSPMGSAAADSGPGRIITLQLGSENLLDTKFPDRLPSLDGRRWSIGASIRF